MKELMEELMEEAMEELMEEVMEEVMEVHHSQVLLWSDRRQLISGSRETQEPAVESVYSVQCTPAVLYSEVSVRCMYNVTAVSVNIFKNY